MFSKPLVVLQSDDWGRVGVRDREGYKLLRKKGLRLGENPYDLYSLETAADITALADLLSQHRDSTKRSACLVMNACVANLNFAQMRKDKFSRTSLLPLAKGLPGHWSRPGLFDAYRAGVKAGVFYPALHGLMHCCPLAIENALSEDGEHARLLKLLWDAETPYIYWRMPWVGYEFLNAQKPRAGFLKFNRQMDIVQQSCDAFTALFSTRPLSACAPGFRSNTDTHRAWAENGIRVAQHGSGSGLRAPYVDEFGLLHVYRNIDFEPALRHLSTEKYLELAAACFARGLPLIISIHSINFHSTLKDFRAGTIAALDQLLSALQAKYPELLYVNDADLYEIVTAGAFHSRSGKIPVTVRRQAPNSPLLLQESW